METTDANPNFSPIQEKQQLPNSTAVLVLGILSIVGCWAYGLPGLAMGIISLVLANNGEKIYKLNPDLYHEPSYNNLKAGRVCAIIGVSLSGIVVMIGIFLAAIAGFTFMSFSNLF
jgi:hypothetical protein